MNPFRVTYLTDYPDSILLADAAVDAAVVVGGGRGVVGDDVAAKETAVRRTDDGTSSFLTTGVNCHDVLVGLVDGIGWVGEVVVAAAGGYGKIPSEGDNFHLASSIAQNCLASLGQGLKASLQVLRPLPPICPNGPSSMAHS